ncbi:hypothetical protein JCM17844_21940 [Iodidimonas gelatinilytica]|uniref:DUF4197 domain-containing protein n=1 Tax=Iodidimonas gelatinilytica TaxID=1236966 RepID=A0A5A7MRJ7_9PROT|nr:DUF4197 domain-containing protein [Iodidimonas gelatinilytica]GEQ98557.1 hypothetical protein JCM17844_21940 [Iodidimonas gelatinilytica]GER02159.1 hypothetical protein JCM17845_27820 [Iodidimonas gelatinilytica]
MSRPLLNSLVTSLLVLTLSFSAQAEQSWSKKAKSLFKKEKTEQSTAALSEADIGSGLREALTVASGRVVDTLSAAGGYLDDPELHIPLPKTLSRVDKTLDRIGMSALTDELEVRLNRAAEAAAPQARDLFIEAISNMTITDARTILTGPDDAATQYLKRQMGPGLAEKMKPVIDTSLENVGALDLYDETIAAYRDVPFVPDVKGDLSAYTTEMAMNGLFSTLAVEEAAIRANPAKRTTDLLKSVFGSLN